MPKKSTIGFLILCIVLLSGSFYPLDAYITKPGGAYPLEPLVNVQGGDTDDVGTMNLMTIALAKATPITYSWAKIAENQKILQSNQVRRPNEDDQEYSIRQLKLMSQSQYNAILVAFQKADLPYEIISKGVFVLNVLPDAAAEGLLKAGDRIVSIDDVEADNQDKVVEYLKSKDADDTVKIQVERDDQFQEVFVKLKPIPGVADRAGLGITFMEDKKIETTPKVLIRSDDIGGPSAGLMFTLELLNQLKDEDLTKGYKVAGTGEMSSTGEVGRIGGIDLKVVAADKAGMEVFFAPDDLLPAEVLKKNTSLRSNYEDARETAKRIGTKMKIVPVRTIDDALTYLENLESKS